MLTAPSFAECADEHMQLSFDSVSIGQSVEPRSTVTLELGSNESSVFSQTDLDVSLTGVMVEGLSVTGFRVFIDAPNADASTPLDDPAYVTSFSFFPTPTEGVPVGTYVIDLEQALARLHERENMSDSDTLTITLVPIGTDDARIGIASSQIVSERP